MKNSKLKKLILLATLGTLAGSVSVNAMEKSKNENNILIYKYENNKEPYYIECRMPESLVEIILATYKANSLALNYLLGSPLSKLAELQRECMYFISQYKRHEISIDKLRLEKEKIEKVKECMSLASKLIYIELIKTSNDGMIKNISDYSEKTPSTVRMKNRILKPDYTDVVKGETLDEQITNALTEFTQNLNLIKKNIEMFQEEFGKLKDYCKNLSCDKNNKIKIK